jgi:plastocyanin
LKRAVPWIALALLPLFAAAGHAEPRTHVIEMSRMAFGPAPADVHVGDKIVWRNKDIFRHTATARNSSFDLDVGVGAEAGTVVETAGKVDYYCRFHPTMTSTVTVLP